MRLVLWAQEDKIHAELMERFFVATVVALVVLVSCNTGEPGVVVDGTFTQTIKVNNTCLLIPAQEKGKLAQLSILADGNNILGETQTINVAQDQIDYYIPIKIGSFKGKKLDVVISGIEESFIVCTGIKSADDYVYEYDEPYRPIYHFSPDFGWTNDPNGMTYFDGEYHLAYQTNPYGTRHFNMHWGNAISEDLVHWKNLPFIVAPDSLGAIYSGSAIVDVENTSGFGENAIIGMYTSAQRRIQRQSIAYSIDRGRTFTKFEGNPVITDLDKRNFRDPKLISYNGGWIVCIAAGDVIDFYGSKDLKIWTKLSDFGKGIGSHDGVWECPDFLKFNVDGEEKWVLLVSINPGGPNGGSVTQYFIGDFDGIKFTSDSLPYPLWIDEGTDNYAGVTFSNTGCRHIFLGWMSNWLYSNDVPTKYFRNAMTIARDLELRDNGEHLFLASVPSPEIYTARVSDREVTVALEDGKFVVEEILPENDGAYEINFRVDCASERHFSLKLYNGKGEEMVFTFDFDALTVTLDRSNSGIVDFKDRYANDSIVGHFIKRDNYNIQLFVDRHSTELFVNDGDMTFTNTMFPTEIYNSLELTVSSARTAVSGLHIYEIK